MIDELVGEHGGGGPRVPSVAEWPSVLDWEETRPSSEEEEAAELAWRF